MPRTKGRNVTNAHRSKTVGTQTDDFDKDIEVARLQEQIKLMEIEIGVLRQYNNDKSPISMEKQSQKERSRRTKDTPVSDVRLSPRKSISRTIDRGCTCKGTCSSKQCGCVKKNSRCKVSCKCSSLSCRNQEENDEDKENDRWASNLETEEIETINIKNVDIKKMENGLLGPNTSGTITDTSENKFNCVDVAFDEKRNRSTTESNTSGNDEQDSMMGESFNPMRPKHQLPRTPPNSRNSREESVLCGTDTSVPVLIPKVEEEETPPPEILNEHEPNWEDHIAKLAPCRKCKRKYFPHRIKKHEACCKGL